MVILSNIPWGFPIWESLQPLPTSLLDHFASPESKSEAQTNVYLALSNGDMELFETAIRALFAAIPYHNYTNNDIARYEGFYASVIFVWFASSQTALSVEDCTNKGRIDMSVETDDRIYLIEFKVDMPGEKALGQIKTKGYAEKYQAKGKQIVLIGIAFSSEERNVTECVWEERCVGQR